MRREIRWTDQSEDHIWSRHQVTPAEVEEVVYTRPRHVAKGPDDTVLVYGRTDAGRLLLVVLVEALDGGFYVATARDLNNVERRLYRRKAR